MKTLLIPTDFSANSKHAASYGYNLAKLIKANVGLCNSVIVPAEIPQAGFGTYHNQHMKTTATDPLLDEELQELYILSSHWASDLSFAEDEIRFLNKIVQFFFTPGSEANDLPEIEAISNDLLNQAAKIACLKSQSAELLKMISPLIGKKNPKIGLGFLEKFSTRQNEIRQTAKEVKEMKTGLFDIVERMLKQHPTKTSQVII
jgi:hypothetical protein